METISRGVLTFLLNSLWQIPLIAVVAALACRLMRKSPASHRHAVWVAALLAAILLPLASTRTDQPRPAITIAMLDAVPMPSVVGPVVNPVPVKPVHVAPVPNPRTVPFAQTTAIGLVTAYLLFLIFRLLKLAFAAIATARIRGVAEVCDASVKDVWGRCLNAFRLNGVELLSSPHILSPVTWHKTVLLPECLLSETSEDVLTAAIGHEMAHIARGDFALNLLYELLSMPIAFHPAAHLIRREIARTREMACDELVTRRLLEPKV
jgi:beta-lactamase regulating signal transducer with metallopeptidase domain